MLSLDSSKMFPEIDAYVIIFNKKRSSGMRLVQSHQLGQRGINEGAD